MVLNCGFGFFVINGNLRCNLERQFLWRGRGDCESTLVCTRLDGNVCGDYAVVADGKDVCFEGEEHRGSLEAGEVYSVSAWASGLDPWMHGDCYFWCTGGGQPPSVKGETDEDLIEALVSTILAHRVIQQVSDMGWL